MSNLPMKGVFQITATYGQVGSYWVNGHKGIDFVSNDTNIYSTCDGVVRKVAYDEKGWGQYVSIGDNEGRRHIFCHLVKGSVKVKEGQRVEKSTIIGMMGATGNVTGPHLHFQLQQGETVIDPTPYLGVPNKKGTYNSVDFEYDGGFRMRASDYRDSKKIPEWAFNAVDEATKDGIMMGDQNGNFKPNEPITRAEFAVCYQRMKGKFKK